MREQRRGRAIAMDQQELDVFLGEERMCRLGSVDATGSPHVSPLWFVWDGSALWLHSVVKSQRWTNLGRDPRVSVVIDAGVGYFELKGAELIGRVEVVGGVPARRPRPCARRARAVVGRQVHRRDVPGRWQARLVRLVPEKVVSWDFRKLALPAGV